MVIRSGGRARGMACGMAGMLWNYHSIVYMIFSFYVGIAPRTAMDRRHFLQTTGTVLGVAAMPRAARSSATNGGRTVLSLNRNWRFSPVGVAGAEAKSFDDSSWERVTIPHANVRTPWHSFDERCYQFISVYRRKFKLPE